MVKKFIETYPPLIPMVGLHEQSTKILKSVNCFLAIAYFNCILSRFAKMLENYFNDTGNFEAMVILSKTSSYK